MYIQTHDRNLILQCLWSPAGNSSYAEDTVDLPTPIFNGPNEATEPEAPIRLYIREAALYEKVLQAIPPSGPGGSKTLDGHLFLKRGGTHHQWLAAKHLASSQPDSKCNFLPKGLVKYLCVCGLFTLVLY